MQQLINKNSIKEKSVVIISGGLDSTTLLYDIISQGYDVYALSFNYNQRHKKELLYAQKTCKKLGIPHKIVDISNLNELLQGSSLTSSDISTPHGKYDEESMKQTVVPNRNMILLSIAAGYAISLKATKLFYGAHSGDHSVYPDCRPEFIQKLKETIAIADWHKVELLAPYSDMDKGDIVIRGIELKVPYQDTWSCYEGGDIPCSKCGACNERAEAFQKAEIKDPLGENV